MKLHLPTRLRSAVFSCFAAVSALCTTLSTGTLVVYATSGTSAYAAYNAATATFEGTDNGAINPTAATYSGVETLIFNMGTSNTGNHLSNDSWTYAGNIQIGAAGATETGFCLNNGNRNQTDVFTGKVTGTGLLSKTGAGTNLTIAFEGDVTEFTGAIRLGSTAPFTLRFGGGSSVPAGQSADHGVSGTGDITFTGWANDTLVYNYSTAAPVYITNRISTNAGATSQVALNGSAHYVLTKDASISSLTLAADNTLHIGTTGKSSATVLGALTMGAGAAVHIDNGSLEVMNASSLAGTYAVGAAGVLHLSRTADLDGALTVAQGGALSIGALSGFADAGGGLQTPAAGENGFASVNGKLSILTGSADKLQALAGTTVLREGGNLELAGDGTVTISEVDHSVYYLRSGEKTLSSLVAESENKLTRIEMGTGGKLAVESGAVQGRYSVESARSVDVSEFGASTIAADIRMENLSATENVTVASGATLSIGSTAEGFSRNINLSADSHLVFEADAPTAMSVGSIINTADRKDDFRRSVRVGEGVSLQASSFVNSWGLKSLTVDGEMNISGALSYETGGEYKGNNAQTNLIDGSGHITAGSLNISNASDNNTISVHELTINGASYIGRATTISAGTTELLGTATVSAALNLTGGHLILGDELSDTATLSGDINLSAGELTLNGTTSLGSNLHQTGGTLTVNGELTQTATLTASGTIALNGTLKADSAALDAIGAVFYSEGVNGYRQGTFVLVNKGEGALSLQRGEQGAVLLDGADATSFLSADAAGNILLADTVGSVYHVFEGEAVYGGDTSTVDTARTTGFGLHGGSLSLLAEREGGHHLNLTADADVTLGAGVSLAAASVTGAEHLTLSGAGTYVVSSFEDFSAVTRGEAWSGTTLINDRISRPYDVVTEMSHGGNLNFRQQTIAEMGGIITNQRHFVLSDNGSVSFCDNDADAVGGAIYNIGVFDFFRNESIEFRGNRTSNGGAICNRGIADMLIMDNGDISFTRNEASANGGAICNYSTFLLFENGDITFTANSGYYGGAIENQRDAIFEANANGNITFSGNTAGNQGGAIFNNGTFSLLGNGDVLFEKNLERSIEGGKISYCLRSIYSTGTLNLSASEGKSILFKDSVYASGEVNLNQGGTGDIIFTGASTEADLREMKGGVDGTAQEILSSRSSVLDASVTLGGGTLQVHDAAELTVKNFTAAAGSELVLHDASFTTTGDSTLAAISVSGSSVLAAKSGANLTLTQAIANNGELTISGAINADALALDHFTAASVYINTAGEIDTSGFSTTSDAYRLALTEGEGTVNGAGAVISHSALPTDVILSLGHNGIATAAELDYSTYYINGGSAALSSILAASPSVAVQMVGGLLTIDTNTNVAIQHDNAAALEITTHLSGNRELSGYAAIMFDAIPLPTSSYDYSHGGAIDNVNATFTLRENGDVSFNGHSARLGGAICNSAATFILSDNGKVTFRENGVFTTTSSVRTDGPSGGAIASYSTFMLSGNGGVTFIRNSSSATNSGGAGASASGGAIDSSSNFTLSGNGDVAFIRNSTSATNSGSAAAAASGGAIASYSTFTLSSNGNVIFIENSASGSSYIRAASAYGGAIFNNGAFSLFGNRDVTFSENSASSTSVKGTDHAYGGAIYNTGKDSTFTLSGNENVTFSGNSVSCAVRGSIHSHGGAIFNSETCTFVLSDNEGVTFSGNTAGTTGGAIRNDGTFMLSGNAAVSFSGNTVDFYGGAIYNYRYGTFALNGNESVTFSGNSVLSADAYDSDTSHGGAIFNGGTSTFMLSGNGDVSFSGNSASSTIAIGGCVISGGAICNTDEDSTFTLSGNGDVTFSGNSVSSAVLDDPSFLSHGGAIFNNDTCTFVLSDNEGVTFSGNTAGTTGGAIRNDGKFTLSGNTSVIFSRNAADSYAGAIRNDGKFTLSGNTSVIFSRNAADSYGGAIFNSGTFSLLGNGDVLFEKNAEVRDGAYRLRSIYSVSSLNLSAEQGKSITFLDSVYAEGTVNLNQAGAGDIIFSGATTEADLLEVKGSAGTMAEIEASRSSYISNATLYNGRLYVEDDASLSLDNLVVNNGAFVVIRNGGQVSVGTPGTSGYKLLTGGFLTGFSLSEFGIAAADEQSRCFMDDVVMDLAKGSTFALERVDLGAGVRITDDPATIVLQDVTAELTSAVNTTLKGETTLAAGLTLVRNDDVAVTLTLAADAAVSLLEATTFDTVTLTGESLVLNCTGFDVEIIGATELIGLSFTSGSDYATFDSGLSVTLTLDGVHYANAYRVQDGSSTILYFDSRAAGAVPEPATATLSLLALAALAARRRRK